MVTGDGFVKLQAITENDAKQEGIERTSWELSCEPYRNYSHPKMSAGKNCSTARMSFCTLWDSINKKLGYGWESNPYVWVYEFERIKK